MVGVPAILNKNLMQSETKMSSLLLELLWKDEGQDVAEYAVMLADILVIVVGTIRLVGSNANTAFSQAACSQQPGRRIDDLISRRGKTVC